MMRVGHVRSTQCREGYAGPALFMDLSKFEDYTRILTQRSHHPGNNIALQNRELM